MRGALLEATAISSPIGGGSVASNFHLQRDQIRRNVCVTESADNSGCPLLAPLRGNKRIPLLHYSVL